MGHDSERAKNIVLGGDIYSNFEQVTGESDSAISVQEKVTSKTLLSLGIRGVKYQASALSGAEGGAENFVIFDESDVAIEEARFNRRRQGTKLFHVTRETEEEFDADELEPGLDGMVHMYEGGNKTLEDQFPVRIEGYSSVPIEEMPEIEDLKAWNPVDMAAEFERIGVLTPEETAGLAEGLDVTSDVREFAIIDETQSLELELDVVDPGGLGDFDALLDSMGEEADFAGDEDTVAYVDQLKETYNTYSDLRNRLYRKLRQKGVRAFKYKTVYERADQDAYSVGIIDMGIVSADVPHLSHPNDAGRPAAKKQRALGAKRVREIISSTVSRWTPGLAPQVRVVDSATDLPRWIRDQVASDPGAAPPDGVFDPRADTVYLIADQITSADQARRVLAHEAVGHHSLSQMLGDDLGAVMEDVRRMAEVDGPVKDVADSVFEDYGPLDDETFGAEVVARMAEQGTKTPIMTRIIAAVRRFLRALGIRIDYSYAEVRDMIRRAATRLEGEADPTPGQR